MSAEVSFLKLFYLQNVSVYDSDPKKYKGREFDKNNIYGNIEPCHWRYDQQRQRLYGQQIPVIVFGIREPQNIIRVLLGENIGTYIAKEV